jgi:hypothetical protein
VFTSAVVSVVRDGTGPEGSPERRMALYFSGREHARENLAKVVKLRRGGLRSGHADVGCAVAERAEAESGRGITLGQLYGSLSGLRNYPARMLGECVERGESFVSVVIIPSCETRPRLHEGFSEGR